MLIHWLLSPLFYSFLLYFFQLRANFETCVPVFSFLFVKDKGVRFTYKYNIETIELRQDNMVGVWAGIEFFELYLWQIYLL